MVINSLLGIKTSQCDLGGNGMAVRVDIYFLTCKNAASSKIPVLFSHPINVSKRPPLTAIQCNSPKGLVFPSHSCPELVSCQTKLRLDNST